MSAQAQPLHSVATERAELADALEDRQSRATYIGRVRAELKAYLQSSRKSQATVAKAIGMSDTVVSQFLADQYRGDCIHVAHSVNSWLALETRRGSALQEPVWIELEQSRQMWRVFSQCHELQDLGMIYGAAGLGKTRAGTQFRREHGSSVIFVTATGAVRSPYAFAAELAEEIGAPSSGTLQRVFKELVKRLRGSGRLLIVDESQKLAFATIDLLRQLRDLSRIGVVLMGDEILWRTITTGRTRAEHERFLSRVGIRRAIFPGMSAADASNIAAQYLGHKDRECIQFLRAKAAGVGGIRAIVNHCHAALQLARLQGRSVVGLEDLERASAELGDDVTLYSAMAGGRNGDEE